MAQGMRSGTQPAGQPKANESNQAEENNADWQSIMVILNSIKESLEKKGGVNRQEAEDLGKVIARVPHTSSDDSATKIEKLEARFDRFEEILRQRQQIEVAETATGTSKSGGSETTWANIAARGM